MMHSLLEVADGKRYGVVYADPPWSWKARSPKGEGRSAKNHYVVMTLDDIKALPVADIAAKDCVLLLWAIDSMLPEALEVMSAWGFKFKTVGFTFVKLNKDGSYFMGTGYHTRANPEQCLIGTRGHPKRLARDVRQLVVAPRREHSRKPDECHDRIERLYQGPYIELFARTERPGWDSWGNEVGKYAHTKEGVLNG